MARQVNSNIDLTALKNAQWMYSEASELHDRLNEFYDPLAIMSKEELTKIDEVAKILMRVSSDTTYEAVKILGRIRQSA